MPVSISWSMWTLRIPIHAGSKDIRNCHINIGTGKEITIAQLADKIVKEVGYQGKLTFDATKPDGTMRKLTDVSKLHSLGWQHKIDIEEGSTPNVPMVFVLEG